MSLSDSVFAEIPPDAPVAVGLSGGMDSAVLLDLACGVFLARGRLRALHVNHGLHDDAGKWEGFCREVCAERRIPLDVLRVEVAKSGAGLEGRAREARYGAFRKALAPGEFLLLGHHLDDQVETLLLRLLRGAGLRGLTGIPGRRALGRGMIFRPLLHCERRELVEYARQRGLGWVEDATNRDTGFDRNFCRHEILPLVERRWPGYRRDWERSRRLIGQADGLLDELAGIDLAHCAADKANCLRVDRLRQLNRPRLHNALRCWVESRIGKPAEPGKLRGLPDGLIAPERETGAEIDFGEYFVRKYRDRLYLLPRLPPVERNFCVEWDPSRQPVLELPGNGSLHAKPASGEGLAGKRYRVRYRQGGESCRLARRPTKTLKKILNEARLAPWLRNRLPLLYDGENIAAIPGIGTAESALTGESAYQIEWRNPY